MEEELSLQDIFIALKRHASKIIFWGLLGLIFAGSITFFLITPTYQSTSKIVVNQTQNSSQTITNTDIQTNLNLINTYQSIIKEPIILEEVIEVTNGDLSVSELANKITLQTQDNSLVFGITVSDDSPYVAADLANAISASFENKIGNILEVESVTVLSTAIPTLNPVSPNVILNLILGFILGIMVGVGNAFISDALNKTVKDENYIEKLGWTNLGSIFEMTPDEVKSTRINNNNSTRTNLNRNNHRRV